MLKNIYIIAIKKIYGIIHSNFFCEGDICG